jgi:pantoate--beta-alanine ligase
MGALHQAHIKLVNTAASRCDINVCSIFVNPMQFNDPRDFEKYPKSTESDIRMLEASAAGVLFLPAVHEVYDEGTSQLEHYDLGYLDTILEGRYRPGHFQGVCQVMRRLLDLVNPQYLFMGQKDYQQCMVIKKLLTLMNSDTQLVTCPTVRETDGLAMSSRNMRLNAEQRKQAPLIFKVLSELKSNWSRGSLQQLKENAVNILRDGGFEVEYVEVADAETLVPLNEWNNETKIVALVAAKLGEVRLIDNLLLNTDG